MRVFTVHLRRHGLDVDRDLAFVKEGFCWPAFLLSFLWALWHRLWIVAIAILCVEAALSWGLAALSPDPVSRAAVSLGVAVIIGTLAQRCAALDPRPAGIRGRRRGRRPRSRFGRAPLPRIPSRASRPSFGAAMSAP